MTALNEPHLYSVLEEVHDERRRQHVKFGEQNWSDGTGPRVAFGSLDYMEEHANSAKRRTDKAAQDGTLTWKDILTEEFFEALAESDQAALRTELVQVAGVAVAWIEKIDRDRARGARTIHDAADDLVRATHG